MAKVIVKIEVALFSTIPRPRRRDRDHIHVWSPYQLQNVASAKIESVQWLFTRRLSAMSIVSYSGSLRMLGLKLMLDER